jgi:large conductance mechanosensitive channel
MPEPTDSSIIERLGQPIKQAHPLLKEFRDFAMRGNVIDLAVGVIIGAAFGKIVDALVNNIIMPPLGILTGKTDLSDRVFVLPAGPLTSAKDVADKTAPMVHYGVFLNAVLNFLIISFTIFVCVRMLNKFYRKPEAPAAPMKDCPFCLSSIPLRATRCSHCTSTLPEIKT